MVISTKDKERVLEAIRKGTIDAADLSFPNLIDAMILKMKQAQWLNVKTKLEIVHCKNRYFWMF